MEPKAPLARCDECPLQGEKYVPGVGPDTASLVVVGEAPGTGEVATGVPFTGASGNLLNNVLKYYRIERDDVYLTNTVLCRPPNNRTPTGPEVAACFLRLIEEVRARHPDTVLALGNTAAKTLLNTRTGITDLRTEVEPKSPYLQCRIVPTFHPAAALRNPDFFPSIVADVKKIRRVKVVWEHTRYKVVGLDENPTDVLDAQVRQSLSNGGVITFDAELDIESMRRYDMKNPSWLCAAISSRPGASVVYTKEVMDSSGFRHKLNDVFTVLGLRWTYQNGKFDIQPLWGSGIVNARVDEDTMLAHYSTDERKGTHDLEQLAVEILGAPKYKTDAREYLPRRGASLAYLPPDILYQYNAADADVTHRLLGPLLKEVANDGVERPYRELLIPGSNALARAEYLGAKIDRGRLDELHTSLSAELQGLEEVLARWVVNPRSPQQVKHAFSELGVGGDGGPSTTNKEFLQGIVDTYAPSTEAARFAKELLEHRAGAKLLSTYVTGLGKSLVRGRVHPTFLLHGTETGRLSCRRPNLQNIPSGSVIRDAFISGPDNVLLSADYSQIEFRLAAILSGDEWLLEQFRQGRQFHKEVARRFYGETWSDVQYLRAKAVNFGILYGRGAKSLSDEWGMSIREAQRLIDDFYRTMPGVRALQRKIEKQVQEVGYLESYFGRKRRFWLVTRENWHNLVKEGYNFPLQSTASDFTLQSLIRLEPLLRGRAAPVITVHDSLIFEVRREHLSEVAQTVQKTMEDTGVQDICPTPVDLKVGTRWGSLKSYAAG